VPPNRIDIPETADRLAAAGGGYEVVHDSPGLEVGVYVLVAPEPDRQEPHEWDELYVVWEGTGTLTIEDEEVSLEQGHAAFVSARAEHRFSEYEQLSLLVVFDKTRG
jgi:mannose-6-phosphate isomerase-like protein (cupin superfamily)